MTLIGIPLIPFAILAAIVLWVLGYISGAYVLAVKMLDAFYGQSTSVGSKLLSLFVVFIVLALLNFIPIVGWLINLAIVFLGLGSLVLRAARSIAHEDMQPIAPPPVVPEVSASSRRSRK